MEQPNQPQSSCVSDETLVLDFRNGDERAVMQLIGRYIPVVKARVSGYAGTELEPEDLAQEGMIGFMQAVWQYDAARGASFRTFALLCIDRSVLASVRSALGKKKIPSRKLVPLDGLEGEWGGLSPEEVLLSKEGVTLLVGKLNRRLSALERRVFFLYVGGCDYEDIAARLQVPVKTVDNALCRARKKLQQTQL